MQLLSHSRTFSRPESPAPGLDTSLPATSVARFNVDETPVQNEPGDFECPDPAAKIERCVAYMESNLNKPLRVSTLSTLLGVSPSHFFYLFKRITGRSPIDFFIRIRMRRACLLLQQTTLSIKEIAVSLGYEDQFYFSRIFKSVTGLAPRNYRLLLLQDQPVTPAKSDDVRAGRFPVPHLDSLNQMPVGGIRARSFFAKTPQASAA